MMAFMLKSILIGLIGMAAMPVVAEEVRISNPSAQAITIQTDGATFVLTPGESRGIDGAKSFRIESDGAIATIPPPGAGEATEAGVVAMVSDPAWESAIAIVNPDDVDVTVTFADRSVVVAAKATERIPLEVSSVTFRASRPVIVFADDVHRTSGAHVITRARSNATSNRRRSVRSGEPPVIQPQPQTVTLLPSKDATLYEIGNGALANGSGPHLFAGTTASGGKRRALVAFHLAPQIPAGSKVTSVKLAVGVSLSASGAENFRLHAVSRDWGEGASNAGPARDGGGTTAQTGDATWIHTSFPGARWTSAGGDFNATADATTSISFGTGTWNTSAALVARVQDWVDHPANNFGWIILGNESAIRNAKRFDSSEVEGNTAPALTVEFTR